MPQKRENGRRSVLQKKENTPPAVVQRSLDFFKFHTQPQQRKTTALFLFIVLAGLLLRLYFALTVHLNLDEGSYLYDAELLREGNVPFKDYYTRSPLLLLFLAGSISILGESYLAGRLFVVLISTLTIPLVYLVGKRIFNRRTGFVAALLFSLSPFTAYHGALIFTEIPQAFFLTLSFVLVLRGLDRTGLFSECSPSFPLSLTERGNLKETGTPIEMEKEQGEQKRRAFSVNPRGASMNFFLAGFVIGACVFIRRTSLLFFAIIIFFLICLLINERRKRGISRRDMPKNAFFHTLLPFIAGFFLVFLTGLLLIFQMAGQDTYGESFFTRAGTIESGSNHFFAFIHFNERGFYLYLPFLFAAIYGVTFLLMKPPTGNGERMASRKRKEERDTEANPPALLSFYSRGSIILLLLFYVLIAALFFLFTWGLFHDRYSNHGLSNLLTSIIYLVSISTFLLLVFVIHPIRFALRFSGNVSRYHHALLWSWFSFVFLFYMVYDHIYQAYIYEFIIPAIILVSHLLLKFHAIFLKDRGNHVLSPFKGKDALGRDALRSGDENQGLEGREKHLLFTSFGETLMKKANLNFSSLIVIFFLFLLLSVVNGYGYYMRGIREPDFATPDDVSEAAGYIKNHTEPGEEIFAANCAVAFQADRPVIFNLSHPTVYRPSHFPNRTEDFPSLDLINYPQVGEIIRYLNESQVRYIIVDPHMDMNYLDHHSSLRDYIEANYVLEKEFGRIRILALRDKK